MKNNDLKKLLQQVVSTPQESLSKICIVRAYDSTNKEITVEPITAPDFNETNGNEDNYIYQVKLSAFQPTEEDTFGYLIIPKIGSYVVISPIENYKWFVSMFSQIELFQVYNESDRTLVLGDSSILLMSDNISLTTKSTPSYVFGWSIEDKEIAIIGQDATVYIENDNGQIVIDPNGKIMLLNNSAEILLNSTGTIAIKNSTFSLKKDILEKLQSIVQSLDIGLTALGGVDPTRTANIALLLATIPLLFED